MKKIILLAFLGITFSTHAQTNHKIILSLQQAIDTGLKNRFDVQANRYDIHLAQNDISKSKKAWIPDIHAEGDVQYNMQLQSTLIPGGFAGFDKPQLLALGAKNTTVFGLTLNQPIYQPGINGDIRLAKNKLAFEKEKTRQSEIQVKMQIATAYFNVLLKRLQYRIASGEGTRYAAYFELAAGKYRHGALIENDYLSAKLNQENATVQAQVARQNYDLSLDKLKHAINIPDETRLVLTDSLGGENKAQQNKAVAFSGMENRTEIRQLKIEQTGNKLSLTMMRHHALPSISFVADYSEQFLYNDLSYFKGQWWKPFSYVGLKISIPITYNFKNKNNIRKEQLSIAQTNLKLRQIQSDIHYEIRKALTDLENAHQNMQSTKSNYELSQTIYKNQQQQFALGAFQYSDLLDTEKSLHIAEQNYISAAYDYLVAKISYEKAVGAL